MASLPAIPENSIQTINDTLVRVDEYVRREYLSVLSQALPVSNHGDSVKLGNLRIIRLDSFTFENEETLARKIRGVYGVLERSGTSAALILDGKKDRVNLYLGVFTEKPEDCTSSYRAFLSSFAGVFPGSEYTSVKQHQATDIMQDMFSPEVPVAVAAVSAFPSRNEESRNFPASRLEALIDGMRGRPFTMILLASAIDRATLVSMRQGYERLCTQISPFRTQDISYSLSSAKNVSLNYSSSISESLSFTTGVNVSTTDAHGTNTTIQSEQDNKLRKTQAASQLIGAGASLLGGIGAAVAGAGTGSILSGLYLSSAASNVLNSAANLISGAYDEPSQTYGEHHDHSRTRGEHEDKTIGRTDTETKGFTASEGKTSGQSLSYSVENKSVSGLLERLGTEIKDIVGLENEGAFSAAAYFVAADKETALSAASLYRSLVTSDGGAKYYSPVYCWDSQDSVNKILSSLLRGEHPAFGFEGIKNAPFITAAQPIGLPDIPRYFCLPGKSVPGLTVTKHAVFARDVLRRDKESSEATRRVSVGNIYHMGSVMPDSYVELDIDTLTSHLFAAGSTGTGKSNFCCHLISQLRGHGIKVLVIEPAKGEYSGIFGADGFSVYGTNPRYSLPLRINPFAFPNGVTSAEHIERLLSIFCAAWPMYSAMPAIMKDALETIYRLYGFDDVWGEKPAGGNFPCFDDLLEVLPSVIRNSEYSQEVQGNYTGALVTRVKSLTSGIYSVIFADDEQSDSELFDEDTIIDLSRVGSEETKSLIMGFIITRLSEYRSVSGLVNSPLRHITLLEEAHRILGRQPQVASPDTGNMKAASVEFIGNAIREMRTYGEGFVIADQSATVMDSSVISNTQTKVFFMMPRREDIETACDAASLTDEQGKELARLPRGTAMILQNNWTDAILCRISRFNHDLKSQYCYTLKDTPESNRELVRLAVKILLRSKLPNSDITSANMPEESFWNTQGFTLGRKRSAVRRVLDGYRVMGEDYHEELGVKGELLEKLLNVDTLMKANRKAANISEWSFAIEQGIWKNSGLDVEEIYAVLSMILLARAGANRDYRKLYIVYLEHKRKESEAANGADNN